ncbi:hypothetical protein, partial [Streptomyces sp. H27-D2]|uniref:hypothetical protein n=1 Tax=Streptomyces sp. H27-D2 TaxID=3046304 RepID=UPI002DBD2A8D
SMLALLLIPVVVLFGLGFLNPLWWVAAAVVVYGAVHYGRGGARRRGYRGDSDYPDYRDYRDHRDRQDRWGRRYARDRRSRWYRQDRRRHEDLR